MPCGARSRWRSAAPAGSTRRSAPSPVADRRGPRRGLAPRRRHRPRRGRRAVEARPGRRARRDRRRHPRALQPHGPHRPVLRGAHRGRRRARRLRDRRPGRALRRRRASACARPASRSSPACSPTRRRPSDVVAHRPAARPPARHRQVGAEPRRPRRGIRRHQPVDHRTGARADVHRRRAEADAIVVGTGTVLADDPALTARGADGELLEHQPLPS